MGCSPFSPPSRVIRLGPHNDLTTLFGGGSGQKEGRAIYIIMKGGVDHGGRDDDPTLPSPPTLPNLIGWPVHVDSNPSPDSNKSNNMVELSLNLLDVKFWKHLGHKMVMIRSKNSIALPLSLICLQSPANVCPCERAVPGRHSSFTWMVPNPSLSSSFSSSSIQIE